MPLFDAILEANARFASGTAPAGVDAAGHADALPLVALTCIDPRLNHLFPDVLGLPEDRFVWLRNAGNIITGPQSSTLRSLALACAVKGGREIAVIGHTDCAVRKATVLELTESFRRLGVERSQLPENLNAFFGLFASERANVLRGVETVRSSPLIGPRVPVHGLLLDLGTRRLECIANGYRALETAAARFTTALERAAQLPDLGAGLAALDPGDVQVSAGQIGDAASNTDRWRHDLTVVEPGANATRPVVFVKGTADPLAERLDKAARFKVLGADQRVYGPVTGLKLLEWIAEGRIGWSAPAQPAGAAEWRPLSAWVESAPAGPGARTPPVLPAG